MRFTLSAIALSVVCKLSLLKNRVISRIISGAFITRSRDLLIYQPLKLTNPDYIDIGDHCRIGPNSTLAALNTGRENVAKIRIGKRFVATASLQIHASDLVAIGDDVLFGSNVFVTDTTHSYADIHRPIQKQNLTAAKRVLVGNGAWIGQNCVILPGVTIGENAVIGANSVVTKSVEANTVVAGVPAQPIKKYSRSESAWIAVRRE